MSHGEGGEGRAVARVSTAVSRSERRWAQRAAMRRRQPPTQDHGEPQRTRPAYPELTLRQAQDRPTSAVRHPGALADPVPDRHLPQQLAPPPGVADLLLPALLLVEILTCGGASIRVSLTKGRPLRGLPARAPGSAGRGPCTGLGPSLVDHADRSTAVMPPAAPTR